MSEARRRGQGRARPGPLALAAALLLAGCAGPPGGGSPAAEAPEAGRGHPTLWHARRAGSGDLYLMGSVHMGRPGPLDLGAAFETLWQRSEELVLEVDFSLYGQEDGERLMNRYGRIPAPGRLRDRLSPETWERLVAHLSARGLSSEPLESFRPWVVATLVAVYELRALGYDPEHGVDRRLHERALAEGMPVAAVETREEQFSRFAALPRPVQDLMLQDILNRADDFEEESRAIFEAWRGGRDRTLAALTFRHDVPGFDTFYEDVILERNEHMADRLGGISGDGRTRLVVIGVAHMLGDRGIPALLAEQGFSVEVHE